MTRQQRIAVARYERRHPATHQAVEPMLSMQDAAEMTPQFSYFWAQSGATLRPCATNPRELPA